MDAELLKLYLEAKAEPVVEEICSQLTLDLTTTCDRALFLVSSQEPLTPTDYKRVSPSRWDRFDNDDDTSEEEFSATAPWDDRAPTQLFVSRIAGRGRPKKVSKHDKAYGHCWVVDDEDQRQHANVLAGRVSTGLLHAVAKGITRRHPHLQAYLHPYRVGASGGGPCGGKRSRQQRDAWGPRDGAQGQEAEDEDEYVYEEGTVQLVCVSWSA
ncbi:hypothetical protein HYH03_012873 [Edaphochlamys debaryana]|uniref:Uncharacterized protein n=1 Tax=Edaphochlamys debaryana TaxID=47281 RepID=A0A835XZP4_9CHLO|nr:hypothetical protein HYH03_012873 [Edaphochlamys debaryana]|eukprot:KAG2488554.1 hypothetical protein HYH03_012873 [Edaphochlamys debaryana]